MLHVTVGCIIQARMSSTRLPGKVLLKLDRQNTVLDYVIQQIGYCKNIKKIIIATTSLKEDDPIEEFAKTKGILYFRGDVLDVLDRYYKCAKLFSLSIIVRITADNPLIDPILVDKAIKKFKSNSCDYASNAIIRSFPYGTETEVFSFTSLGKVWNNAKKYSEREHVTPYFYNHPEKFKVLHIKNRKNLSFLRWTIDQYDDFVLVKKIVSKIKKRPILMNDIVSLFNQEPELISINKHVKHKILDDKTDF